MFTSIIIWWRRLMRNERQSMRRLKQIARRQRTLDKCEQFQNASRKRLRHAGLRGEG
jgi:hypothetical protein